MSDTVLSATLHAAALALGDRLPAAYGLEAGDVLVDGDATSHRLPADAVAVRWPVGGQAAVLVVAIPADSAALLRSGPPEVDLVTALTPRVAAVMAHIAPLLGGAAELGAGEEVPAEGALATGPGDAVSVPLSEAGVHRATLGLRMVVPDALMQPADGAIDDDMGSWEDDMGDDGDDLAAAVGGPTPAGPVGLPQPVAPRGKRGVRPGYRDPVGMPAGDAHPAEFTAFDQLHGFPGVGHSMSMLADVEMGVTAELGRTKLTVRDVLALNQGSIIELDRAAGSPVDVVVNGTLIARGEVVVIDEEFGIRITEIVGMDEGGAQAQLPMAQ